MDYFTYMGPIFLKHGIILPNFRSNFHLNEKAKLVKLFEDAGFTNCQCWNTTVSIPATEEHILFMFKGMKLKE